MFIICPDCAAADQEVGKYCENCGRLLSAADAQKPAPVPSTPAPWTDPALTPGGTSTPPPPDPTAADPPGSARFAVVRNRQANPGEGFTLTHAGEFLVGRPNQETGSTVDIDVRQWVQPFEYQGQKQFLVHRNQCYLGIAADGAFTIRSYPGYEADTLVRPPGGQFVSLQDFATVRPLRPDNTFPLLKGDQIFMGDPSAVAYYVNGDPTAAGTYLVLEVM